MDIPNWHGGNANLNFLDYFFNPSLYPSIWFQMLDKTLDRCQAVGLLEMLGRHKLLELLVPEVGIEPTRTQGPLDFESSASTSFTTPAT